MATELVDALGLDTGDHVIRIGHSRWPLTRRRALHRVCAPTATAPRNRQDLWIVLPLKPPTAGADGCESLGVIPKVLNQSSILLNAR